MLELHKNDKSSQPFDKLDISSSEGYSLFVFVILDCKKEMVMFYIVCNNGVVVGKYECTNDMDAVRLQLESHLGNAAKLRTIKKVIYTATVDETKTWKVYTVSESMFSEIFEGYSEIKLIKNLQDNKTYEKPTAIWDDTPPEDI